jgi:hypothetical protein
LHFFYNLEALFVNNFILPTGEKVFDLPFVHISGQSFYGGRLRKAGPALSPQPIHQNRIMPDLELE